MLFLVDGYNVTRRDPATSSLTLEAQRDALVARLRVRGRNLLGNGRIIVVFDGEGGPGLSAGGGVPVEIVYAHRHSADDEIVRIATKASGKVVLISGDRELCARVVTHVRGESETRGSECCFDAAGRGSKRRDGGKRGSIARDVGLPRGANSITAELKDLWLNDED